MELDPATLVNAGGLALFAIAVLLEIRKLAPTLSRITDLLVKLEERSRLAEERVLDLEARLSRRRLVTPHGGVAPIYRRPPTGQGDE